MGNNGPINVHHFGPEASQYLAGFSHVEPHLEPCLKVFETMVFHGLSMGFQWVNHGFSMGVLCFFPQRQLDWWSSRRESPPWDSTRHRTWWPSNLQKKALLYGDMSIYCRVDMYQYRSFQYCHVYIYILYPYLSFTYLYQSIHLTLCLAILYLFIWL